MGTVELVLTVRTETDWQMTDSGSGGDGFAAFFVLALVIGIAGTVWKVSTARRMARDSGMDEADATAMALFTDEGLESTYLASNLRGQVTPAPEPERAPRDSAQRLRELESLRSERLVTEEEYAERRRAILDSL